MTHAEEVQEVHVNYPHWPGYLYDCEACEGSCHCSEGSAECVWRGHNESETE